MKKMAKDNDAEQPSGSRNKQTGISPSAAKLNQILGDSPAPRNLTPYEIDLLRKAAQETAEVAGEVFAGKTTAGDQDKNS